MMPVRLAFLVFFASLVALAPSIPLPSDSTTIFRDLAEIIGCNSDIYTAVIAFKSHPTISTAMVIHTKNVVLLGTLNTCKNDLKPPTLSGSQGDQALTMLETDLGTTTATLSALVAAKQTFRGLPVDIMSYVCSDIQSLGLGRLEFATDFRTVITNDQYPRIDAFVVQLRLAYAQALGAICFP